MGSPVADSSTDFIAFSDSDCSPVTSKKEFNESPSPYQNKTAFFPNNRNSNSFNQNRSWNAKYNSPNNSGHKNWYRNNNRNFRNSGGHKQYQSNNRNKYVHPSFLEDPWAALIKQQNQSLNSTDQNECTSNSSHSENVM